jgi:dolichol-phosphate mannosyltransferase
MQQTPVIWILLPAYNEAQSLPKLLPKLAAAFAGRGEYRVVVVDDGSDDGTSEILRQQAVHYPLSVVKHSLNRGLGETERDGFEHVAERAAPTDIIVRLDCDDTHEASYIWSMLGKLAEGFDVVNTSRFQPGGGQLGVSTYRGLISRAANIFMKVIFRIRGVHDYSCGFRAYRAEVIQDAVRIYENSFIQLRGLGFTSTLEMLVKLNLMGCRFAEVPFVLRYDQKESSSKMVTSITTLGYMTMAILSYWPFGGWRSQYRGLARMYRENRELALRTFSRRELRRRTVSRISF